MHSTASDGGYAPARLMEMAHARGLKAVALTDHDTTSGCADAARRAAELGLEFISGVEFEAAHPRGALHILGYFVDSASPALQAFMSDASDRRRERNATMLARLEALDMGIAPDELRHRDLATLSRPHFADALVRAGHVRSFRAAFDELLCQAGRAYVPLRLSRHQDVIAAIRAAGGIASLAHPSRLCCESLLELRTIAKALRDAGLEAIEVWHPSHSPRQTGDYGAIAAALELCPTGGSDFHRLPPRPERGVGFGRVSVDYSVLEALRARHSSRK